METTIHQELLEHKVRQAMYVRLIDDLLAMLQNGSAYPIPATGNSDADALIRLVKEAIKQKQEHEQLADKMLLRMAMGHKVAQQLLVLVAEEEINRKEVEYQLKTLDFLLPDLAIHFKEKA